jgi:hypothetical protein
VGCHFLEVIRSGGYELSVKRPTPPPGAGRFRVRSPLVVAWLEEQRFPCPRSAEVLHRPGGRRHLAEGGLEATLTPEATPWRQIHFAHDKTSP